MEVPLALIGAIATGYVRRPNLELAGILKTLLNPRPEEFQGAL